MSAFHATLTAPAAISPVSVARARRATFAATITAAR